jgi:hypothetical protein
LEDSIIDSASRLKVLRELPQSKFPQENAHLLADANSDQTAPKSWLFLGQILMTFFIDGLKTAI